MTVLTSARPISPEPGRFHWTVDAFYRAIAAGVFNDPRQYELVNGELWEKEPMNPPHASAIRRIMRVLLGKFERNAFVMVEMPVHLANDGEPRPDVCVIAGQEDMFETRHPSASDILLLIEVADTSLVRDTTEKALLYAQAGIADYWVSIVPTRELLVFRNPTPDGYPAPLRLTDADTICPLCAPEAVIAVRDLIASPVSSHADSGAEDATAA